MVQFGIPLVFRPIVQDKRIRAHVTFVPSYLNNSDVSVKLVTHWRVPVKTASIPTLEHAGTVMTAGRKMTRTLAEF